MNLRARIVVPAALASLLALSAVPAAGSQPDKTALGKINHIVVIYQENHSFDNLYGTWERVNNLSQAAAANKLQVNQGGAAYTCLLQNDSHLTSPPLSPDCTDTTNPSKPFTSHFFNMPFTIDPYAPNNVATRDLVHRYYQEQYQLNGGKQNRYVTGSDAVGLTMGVYNTADLPIYQYLHQAGHPQYAIADKFFQAAFGGSFLNHQWLAAAATPIWRGPNDSPAVNDGSSSDLHSVVDDNGMPNNYPLYTSPWGLNSSPTGPKDGALTASCEPAAPRPKTPPGVVCGDRAVNTIQPQNQPYFPGTGIEKRLPALTAPNIGDELSGGSVGWAWYAGGWSNAAGNVGAPGWSNGKKPTKTGGCPDSNAFATAVWPNCPDKLFQFHHQPFNYFANYAPGTDARAAHLRDEQEFLNDASSSTAITCNLKPVSFIKPIGAENEHPGYTNEAEGSRHLVNLIKAVQGSACKNDTLIVATYDEFGGFWDHVTPPGQGGTGGTADQWGPGTRIPALIISPFLNGDFVVDHVPHDTTSILATIEHRFGLAPLSTRDASVRDLSSVYKAQ